MALQADALAQDRDAKTSRRWAQLALIITVILWGSAYVAIRAGLAAYGPEHLALLRFIAASTTFLIIASWRRLELPPKKEWPKLIGLGLIGMAGYSLLLNYGERRVTSGAASFIVNTCPVIVSMLVWIIYRERPTRRALTGSLLALFGVFFVALGEETAFELSFGVLLVFFAASFQALFFVLQKPLLQRYGPLRVTCCVVWSGALCLLPWSSGLLDSIRNAPLHATISVVYLGALPGAIGYSLWAYVSKVMPVAQAATYLYTVPLVALAIGWMWLGETPHWLSIAGGGLALGGVVIANTRRVTSGPNPVVNPKCAGESALTQCAPQPVAATPPQS